MRQIARRVPFLAVTLISAASTVAAAGVDRDFFRTGPSAAAPRAIVLDFLAHQFTELGVTDEDLHKVAIVREYRTRHNGVTHFKLLQTVGGIEVDGTEISLAVDRQGRIFHPVGRALSGLEARAAESIRTPRLGPDEAVIAAADALGTPRVDGLDLVDSDRGAVDQAVVFANPAVSEEQIPVRLRYVRIAGDRIRLAWNLSLKAPGDSNWWNAWIDADSGALLRRDNWTNDVNIDTYSVFASPKESPLDGGRTNEVDPWQVGGTSLPDGSSPFGWHDTNGVLGEDFTDTRGNNVEAQTDLNANNTCCAGGDIRGAGGVLPDLDFLPPFNPALPPSGYLEAAVVNLFYWNNILHDVTYQYGFDEASGNFQFNNYGRGGVAGDPVQADAQDGSGTNNANFSTPGDGTDPRMQMYVWSAPQNIHENSPTVADFPAGARAAGWGGSPTFNLTDDLVFVNDGVGPDVNDGCERPTPWGVTGQIALVRRGNCEFGLKGLNGQLEGAVGVILINNGSNGVAGMGPGASGASVTIPVQMIGKANGNGIVAELGGGPVNVTMSSTATLPDRDSDLDNGVIAHEYGHGVSNRLTGVGCLSGDEQMGEGWSDWMTLFLHAKPADVDVTERSVGGYVTFEPADTPGFFGIRTVPYTTDMALNPQTYATLSSATPPAIPHGVGAVWAQMLWEVYWNLVHLEGYDADIYYGTGGNNVAFQLVMDGMKNQICAPGFVDGRNAILAADAASYEGNHTCEIWKGFAKRGLGFSALQGSSAFINDGTPAFDLPAACVDQIFSDSFSHESTSHWDVTTPP